MKNIWTAQDVKEFRMKNHLSRPRLARLLGVCQETLYNWESGRVKKKILSEPISVRLSQIAKEV